jgi:hypothetical protein
MELLIPQIPPDFIRTLPKGFRLIERSGHQFLLVEELFCPVGHGLIVESVRVHDEPSIKLNVEIGDSTGALFIDSYWGSHAKLFSFIPSALGSCPYVQACCPHCGQNLGEDYQCDEPGCASEKGILLTLPGEGNRIHVCARLGCPGHKLEITDLPREVVHRVSSINFFGAGVDEVFGGFSEQS